MLNQLGLRWFLQVKTVKRKMAIQPVQMSSYSVKRTADKPEDLIMSTLRVIVLKRRFFRRFFCTALRTTAAVVLISSGERGSSG